ncbi:MAG: ribonuclease Z [Muribaculaceae bacterium]|nr:ribonuclease Z [Muribaculaceae bacterium]
MEKFRLNILGCGSATCTTQHMQTSQVLDIRDNLFMIDCGEGTQLQMRRMRLKFARLNNIFISHLHGDHCFGLLGMLSTLALLGKTGTMTIHIFKEGADFFKNALDFFAYDMPFEVRFNIIPNAKALIYEDDAITVTTIPLSHRVPAVGFLFEEKPKKKHINREMTDFYNIPVYKLNGIRNGEDFITKDGNVIPNEVLTRPADPSVSYAYCSDTVYSKKVIETIKGVDWLYHESTYADDKYLTARKRGHSTAREAATAAMEAGAKHLILGHFSSQYHDNTRFRTEAMEVFPDVTLAKEGLVLELTK